MQLITPRDTVKTAAAKFTGDVYMTPIKTPTPPSRLVASLVRFTPAARTNWHAHAVGQTLYVTEANGLIVSRDGTVVRVRAGDAVWTPPGEEHWHGGTATTMMCHISLIEVLEGSDGTSWLEPVTEVQFHAANDNLDTREIL